MDVFSALSFAQPAILAGLLSLPVIWFLLRLVPPPPARQRFPALFFLRDLKDESQTASKAPWWILLLRLLILALVIIGLAGPMLNKPEKAIGSGAVVFVIDNSWPAANGWELRRNTLLTQADALRNTDRQIFVLLTAPVLPRLEDEQLRGPLSADDLAQFARSLEPQAFAPDYQQALKRTEKLASLLQGASAEINWLSDGVIVSTGEAQNENNLWRLVNRLTQLGDVTLWRENTAVMTLDEFKFQGETILVPVTSTATLSTDREVTLNILARNGRVLANETATLLAGETTVEVPLTLPLVIRNEIGLVRLQGTRSAGAVQLADASARRVKVGLVTQSGVAQGSLLEGTTYLKQALSPYAEVSEGAMSELARSGTGLIVLDDIGRLRESDRDTLSAWVDQGGIVLRFAGPNMADAIGDGSVPLTPGRLRSGGRAFGGAMTWEAPQKLAGFSPESPFADLALPDDVIVRRQILSTPIPDPAFQNWAWLEDGTPLVTAEKRGRGLLIFIHVTTTPNWSDLPISGEFVEMMRRILTLPERGLASLDEDIALAPWRVMNGFGSLNAPDANLAPVKVKTLGSAATPHHPPGLYGNSDTPVAVNVISNNMRVESLDTKAISNFVPERNYTITPARALAVYAFVLALILALLDTVISLWMRGLLKFRLPQFAALFIMAFSLTALPQPLKAQELLPIDAKTAAAALETRLAYFATGNSAIDRVTEAGLATLSKKLKQRTALEPASPIALDLEEDDLSVYPLIYWVITENTPIPSDYALAGIEGFMAGGGLLIIDTRDGDVAPATRQTPAGDTMRSILSRINIPPLEPMPPEHGLGRSFYLLDDLPGRNDGGTVWVEARSAMSSENDGVTPLIIGGRDWAGAWALDGSNVPYLPMGSGNIIRREHAFRAGINMVMVALTGSYKTDQLQVTTLLEQLGRDEDPFDAVQP